MTNGLRRTVSVEDLARGARRRAPRCEDSHAALDALLAPRRTRLAGRGADAAGIRWRLRNVQDKALTLDERLQQAQRWVAAAPHSY
jgi:hypothetical protein